MSGLDPEGVPDPVPSAARALIGRRSTRRFEVTARDIKRFAQAIGEPNPVHFDEAAAHAAGYETIVAPPLFCQVMTFEDLPLDQLPADGSPAELAVPLPAERTVGGGSEYRVHRLVRAGEVVTVTTVLRDVTVKSGKSGPFFVVAVETEFADSNGHPIASELATYVKRT